MLQLLVAVLEVLVALLELLFSLPTPLALLVMPYGFGRPFSSWDFCSFRSHCVHSRLWQDSLSALLAPSLGLSRL